MARREREAGPGGEGEEGGLRVRRTPSPTTLACSLSLSPFPFSHPYPMVVMKLDVNWSSAKRSRRQDLPTPGRGVGRERGEHGDPIGRSESVCVASAPLSISLTAVPNQQQLDQVVVVRALGGGRHGCGVCVEEAGREAGAARKTRGERIRGEKPASERAFFPTPATKKKKEKEMAAAPR